MQAVRGTSLRKGTLLAPSPLSGPSIASPCPGGEIDAIGPVDMNDEVQPGNGDEDPERFPVKG
jgi:hypothetical protein